MQYNNPKAGGIVYKVCDEEMVGKPGKEFPKRIIWIEVPTLNTMSQGTEIFKLETIFEETRLLDDFSPGDWVDFIYSIKGRKYTSKKTGEEDVFNSMKLIDIRKGPNPFDKGKDVNHKPEELNSNSIVSELADRVKDYGNEVAKQDTLFAPQVGDPNDDLPF